MKISVIIPTLNESSYLNKTLDNILAQDPFEVVVADGGSSDATCDVASERCTVVCSDRGRSRQMNVGASHASGDVFLFLHADTLLPEGALSSIEASLSSGANAGTFRLAFDRQHPLLLFSSLCTRVKTPSLCFGDRGLYVTRESFFERGGFPDQLMFEDIDMAKALASEGRFDFLPGKVITSSRRFEEYGIWKQQLRNLRLWLRYRSGEPIGSLESEYAYPSGKG